MESETIPATKGRPREFCVDQALAEALRVFWTKGYDGASMADLTEAMGITKPSLYAAFGNKEALFHKRSEEHTSELQSLMRISYAVFCLKKKKHKQTIRKTITNHHNANMQSII